MTTMLKIQNFGIEIELTGITRAKAASTIAKVLGGSVSHDRGAYDTRSIIDNQGRKWQVMRKRQIPQNYSVPVKLDRQT